MRRLMVGAALCLALGSATTFAATWTWNGGGANNLWSTAQNWSPASVPANDGTANLVMYGGVTLTSTANSAWSIHSLAFPSNPAFTLSGSPLTIGSGGVSVPGSTIETMNNAVVLGATRAGIAATLPIKAVCTRAGL